MILSTDSRSNEPEIVSGRGIVITSVNLVSIIGFNLLGMPKVTIPEPILIAPIDVK